MREVLNLHIGQAGCTIGDACWEQLCVEQNIAEDGSWVADAAEGGDPRSVFAETRCGRLMPRAVFVDTETMVVDGIAARKRGLYNANWMLTGIEDAANLYTRGYYTVGSRLVSANIDAIRKMADDCDDFQGFMVTNSVVGGTGSGVFVRLLEHLSVEHPKKTKIAFTLFPSPTMRDTTVEPYNSVMAAQGHTDHCDAVCMMDNEALYSIARTQMRIEKPCYADTNRIISQAYSSVTAPSRFSSGFLTDLNEFVMGLVPHRNLKFLQPSFSPFIGEGMQGFDGFSAAGITESAFDKSSLFVSVPSDPGRETYLAACLIYRGDVTPKDVYTSVSIAKSCKRRRFVDWVPTGFKAGVISTHPKVASGSPFSPGNRSLSMFASTLAAGSIFSRIGRRYDQLFSKRAFIHWFVGEGLSDGEFSCARENIEVLIRDYTELLRGAEQPEEEEDEY
eukprot:TRINITY_DN16538_c0_g1_i1.p1 TRINITY_DN16538_c0_g1~~TRINITY_DN16538_c0_g1_i1.p1  ORF type:complete len:462 (+),score=48.94 TRINITY_DN16538_c0_g1_i1:44-1387(+)